MGYYRQLALELRRRGLSEPEVVQQLRATAEIAGDDPAAVFGTPVDYAQRFPVTPHRSVGQWVAQLGLLWGIVIVIVTVVRWLTGETSLWSGLVVAAGVIILAVVLGLLVDRRLPDGEIRAVDRVPPGSVGG